MATGGLYGSSGTGALIAQPGSESSGLYGNSTSFGGTYFEWFVFQTSETQPATPTGGTWNFTTNANTPPTGWSSAPPSNPLNTVWVSIAIVNSKNTAPLVWSVPGKFAFSSGLPILFDNGAPQPGDGQSDQLYVQLDTTPQTIWAKETGTWTRLTGSTLYADLTSNQTIAGTKTFSNQIQGSISGTASNVTGTVAISNGGTGATTAASARAALGAAELGANADITSMTGVTGGISTPDFVQFDTGITPTVGVGKLQWDPTHGCMQVGLVGGNVNLQIGEETVAYVYNNTGSTITEGQVVRVVGSQGQRLTVALAQADGDPNSATILGMATENIANNSSGFITTQGVVNNLNTNGFADGTLLYLSPTVPGGVTATKPVAPQHLVWIGYVVKGNSGGAGSIYIHTQNGYELDELHNVKITDPVADNSFLVYDATLEVWQNEAPSAARTSLGLGSAAVLNAGAANGVATLDAGGTVPLSQIPASIQGGVSYQGTWNATTNTPTLTSSVGTKGYYYVVSVAGSTNLNGITSWNIGDWAIYNGTAWEKIDNTDAVTSVNGYTGTVVLNYADVGAPSTTGVNATGTWGINVTGNAATATTAGSATTATTATNVSGGTASVTTLTTSSTVTLNGGTANGVAYLNGSKVLTTGSALTFDGTNLGINNTAPASKLDVIGSGAFRVDGSGSTTPLVLRNNNTASTQLVKLGFDSNGLIKASINAAVYGNDYMTFNVGSDAEQMRLTSTGLGIGTSSPASLTKLTVFQDSTFAVQLMNSSQNYTLRVDAGVSNALILGNRTSFTDLLTISTSGNLGLGVTPSASTSTVNLQVKGTAVLTGNSSGAEGAYLTSNAIFNSGWKYISTAAASRYDQGLGAHAWFTAPSGTAGNAISFTQAMTLDASGFLGVGETSPTSRIHANGTIQARTGATGVQIYGDGGSGYVNSVGANPLILQVNSTERARIDSSGRFGVGTTSFGAGSSAGSISFPPYSANIQSGNFSRLWVPGQAIGSAPYAGLYGLATTYLAYYSGGWKSLGGGTASAITIDEGIFSFSSSQSVGASDTALTWTTRFMCDTSGNLLIGATTAFGNSGCTGVRRGSSGQLIVGADNGGFYQQVVGNYYLVTTAGGSTSDATLKTNVQQLSGALDKVCAIRGVNFEFIDAPMCTADQGTQLGVIAQEVEAQYPEIVLTDEAGKKTVRYDRLVAPLIEAIKEQQAIIEDMKNRLAALESN